eukprot:gb/GEZJ01004865.1/.p1 GENE.gb/GEZJ01004865.1/~~gb/GEZJ01004865.1/.p1  ORF type:complete len:231 (-),score=8.48 gb/GEZJ01004865.1/:92-784(-)
MLVFILDHVTLLLVIGRCLLQLQRLLMLIRSERSRDALFLQHLSTTLRTVRCRRIIRKRLQLWKQVELEKSAAHVHRAASLVDTRWFHQNLSKVIFCIPLPKNAACEHDADDVMLTHASAIISITTTDEHHRRQQSIIPEFQYTIKKKQTYRSRSDTMASGEPLKRDRDLARQLIGSNFMFHHHRGGASLFARKSTRRLDWPSHARCATKHKSERHLRVPFTPPRHPASP